MTTSLVIGSGGFCGRHLVARLSREPGARVVRMERDAAADTPIVPGDVRDLAGLKDIVRRVHPDQVFNLAGVAAGDPLEIYSVNVTGGMNVLEAVRTDSPNARVLVVGSAAEYGNYTPERMPLSETSLCSPQTVYGASKLAATLGALEYARRHGTKVVVARPFNIVGAGAPTTQLVGATVNRLKVALRDSTAAEIEVGNTSPERDFISVEAVVDAYVELIAGAPAGEVFNICSGAPVSVQRVIDTLRSFSPRPIAIRQKKELMRPDDPPSLYGSWSKAHRQFGFTPTFDLDASLKAAWDGWHDDRGCES